MHISLLQLWIKCLLSPFGNKCFRFLLPNTLQSLWFNRTVDEDCLRETAYLKSHKVCKVGREIVRTVVRKYANYASCSLSTPVRGGGCVHKHLNTFIAQQTAFEEMKLFGQKYR